MYLKLLLIHIGMTEFLLILSWILVSSMVKLNPMSEVSSSIQSRQSSKRSWENKETGMLDGTGRFQV